MEELKEGMYVRTEQFGNIGKYMRDAYENPLEYIEMEDSNYTTYTIPRHTIVKASHNIIDLIEVGDYVNSYKVSGFENTYFNGVDRRKEPKRIEVIVINGKYEYENLIKAEDIKSIVTKEQFEQNSYKVGE